MYYLNIYTTPSENKPFGDYVCSIGQNTRKQCIKIANEKYSLCAWDWDDKNYVKNKKFLGDPSTTVSLNLITSI
jgi:hypothetical protein